jgi:trans-aconitate 2-methyltransferase
VWDPQQYVKFAHERARPFHDLLARVRPERVRTAADLGCGPGELTRTIAERWPTAAVVGVDNSPEMLDKAQAHALPGRLRFEPGDLATWRPEGPLDLLVSNAALHWAADHAAVLAAWSGMLSPAGVMAVQMPYRFRLRAQRAVDDTARDPRWADKLTGAGLNRESVHPPPWYVRRLQALGLEVDAWKTTYYHVLTGEDPVLEWLKGTGLRPLLARLTPGESEDFQRDLGARLRQIHPPRDGTVLLPFPRIFFVATRPASPAPAVE